MHSTNLVFDCYCIGYVSNGEYNVFRTKGFSRTLDPTTSFRCTEEIFKYKNGINVMPQRCPNLCVCVCGIDDMTFVWRKYIRRRAGASVDDVLHLTGLRR